jgi:hypothetical protein
MLALLWAMYLCFGSSSTWFSWFLMDMRVGFVLDATTLFFHQKKGGGW